MRKETDEVDRNNVRLRVIGRTQDLPEAVREELSRAATALEANTGLMLVLALSYAGRVEILDAVKRIAAEARSGEIEPKDIDEALFSNHLYTAGLPDPDLLVRTSGELRISNFLLWQIAYSELWITDTLWPDFRREHLYRAVMDYQKRERRFGRVSPKRSRGK